MGTVVVLVGFLAVGLTLAGRPRALAWGLGNSGRGRPDPRRARAAVSTSGPIRSLVEQSPVLARVASQTSRVPDPRPSAETCLQICRRQPLDRLSGRSPYRRPTAGLETGPGANPPPSIPSTGDHDARIASPGKSTARIADPFEQTILGGTTRGFADWGKAPEVIRDPTPGWLAFMALTSPA